MHIGTTEILDTHAEAFSARYARLIVTAIDAHWVEAATRATTGYATSIIGCDFEAGVDRNLSASETPDGRSGASLLFFAFTAEKLANGLASRVGQCVLTCPTTACFDGLRTRARRSRSAIGSMPSAMVLRVKRQVPRDMSRMNLALDSRLSTLDFAGEFP